jgi:hypothetical protein
VLAPLAIVGVPALVMYVVYSLRTRKGLMYSIRIEFKSYCITMFKVRLVLALLYWLLFS